mmetsp:Transcript_94599/g.262801  ORF Transcript_94599/g.262801 Transcript_94599/m.262801 type:complete len:241 (+) Transcript_94599:178-900(+)
MGAAAPAPGSWTTRSSGRPGSSARSSCPRPQGRRPGTSSSSWRRPSATHAAPWPPRPSSSTCKRQLARPSATPARATSSSMASGRWPRSSACARTRGGRGCGTTSRGSRAPASSVSGSACVCSAARRFCQREASTAAPRPAPACSCWSRHFGTAWTRAALWRTGSSTSGTPSATSCSVSSTGRFSDSRNSRKLTSTSWSAWRSGATASTCTCAPLGARAAPRRKSAWMCWSRFTLWGASP